MSLKHVFMTTQQCYCCQLLEGARGEAPTRGEGSPSLPQPLVLRAEAESRDRGQVPLPWLWPALLSPGVQEPGAKTEPRQANTGCGHDDSKAEHPLLLPCSFSNFINHDPCKIYFTLDSHMISNFFLLLKILVATY